MAKSRKRTERSPVVTLIGVIVIFVSVLIGMYDTLTKEKVGEDNEVGPQPDVVVPGDAVALSFDQGFGAEKGFWQVYFTVGNSGAVTGGVDEPLIAAIGAVQGTLDIAAFEWNNPRLTEAVLAAQARGVTVRMVVDDEHTVEDNEEALDEGEESPFQGVIDAGISFVDDGRSGLMHNKFMIMDGATVWTGSMNYTMNGSYRNNNNLLMMRSRRAVEAYQAEFNEMFVEGEFGSSRSPVNGAQFTQDGVAVQILFAPEDDPVPVMLQVINNAQTSVRFMTFSFTRDDVGEAVLARAEAGVDVMGVFELTGSETPASEMTRLFCAGLPVFQDGNPGILHHKVFIIDAEIVLTGSFNISENATTSNDENMVIIHDADLAAQYLAEFERVRSQASVPSAEDIECP